VPVVLIATALGRGMKVERDSYDGGKSGRFTPEEAQRRLDEVRTRYGIHLANQQARPIDVSSSAPKEPAKQKLRPARSLPKTPFIPLDRMRPGPVLKRGGTRRTSGPPSDNQSFHYLIRIAECVSILHCEVVADSDAAARDKVEQIPNLVAWQAISVEELAELIKHETTPSTQV
jgi:hypothetical protein